MKISALQYCIQNIYSDLLLTASDLFKTLFISCKKFLCLISCKWYLLQPRCVYIYIYVHVFLQISIIASVNLKVFWRMGWTNCFWLAKVCKWQQNWVYYVKWYMYHSHMNKNCSTTFGSILCDLLCLRTGKNCTYTT